MQFDHLGYRLNPRVIAQVRDGTFSISYFSAGSVSTTTLTKDDARILSIALARFLAE